MNKFSLLLLSLIFFSSSPLAFATVLVPTPPPIAARNYILQDFYSGKIFMKKNADERIEPASLTKLMTAYLVFQKLRIGKIKLTDKVKISEKAQNMSEYTSRMYLEVGTEVQVELLLKGMIIQSGNDASIALAELIGGTEEAFATLMNAQAQRLGLKNTHYMNSTGLPSEEHYSSASDTALLAYALVRHFPEYYRWYSEREFTFNEITQKNRNLLLRRDPSVDGIKTGHTSGAGYCLAASAKRGEMRLISVIMGAKSEKARAKASEKMLDYGFRFFDTYSLYKAHEPLDLERVWYGKATLLQLGLEKSLYVTVPENQYKQLNATLYIDKYIMAPVVAGKTYGTLKIHLGNQVISERPLIALSSIEKGSFWKRLIDSFSLFFY
ncbi:MAG: serine-type D-Ala-D-Ala carboxypeptidase [Gammaproteobacteria bacterium]|nr:MAG: serine-type D-Ala-D-Ala carboxypeptidase [Gammaproteobacteria bacterium]RKZ44214.1 MAG: serine-type D-Ala-D-Ala carboxypeptidase [Gammaproteobacteria bacterium]RKZ75402.1 MAG: serine-type D-Ala-D-Ala carboxypeptidase [Gammaproteobacteria bacterium]